MHKLSTLTSLVFTFFVSTEGCPGLCNSNGRCTLDQNGWHCVCQPGWRGAGCDVAMETLCTDSKDNEGGEQCWAWKQACARVQVCEWQWACGHPCKKQIWFPQIGWIGKYMSVDRRILLLVLCKNDCKIITVEGTSMGTKLLHNVHCSTFRFPIPRWISSSAAVFRALWIGSSEAAF